MQVTETLSDGLKRGFTVVVPETELKSKREKRLAELSRTVNIPGFRPGKVPLSMVQKRYGEAVAAEVAEAAVNDASDRLLSERNLRPAVQPKLDVKNPGLAADLEFTMEFEVLPDIAIPALDDIAITKPVAVAGDTEIDAAIKRIAESRQNFAPVEEARGAAKGEQLSVDFIGRINGEAFEGGTATDATVVVAGPGFIPGFSEQMEGLAPGETRTITVTFPAEYGAKELAGKEAQFEITAKSLAAPAETVIDEEFAKSLGVEDLEALRKAITEQLEREYANLTRMKVKRALLDQLAERAQFATPEVLVDAEFAEIWRQVESEKAAGRLEPEEAAKDEETLKAEYRAIADRRVRLGLLVAEIGRSNAVVVTDQELQRAAINEALRYRDQAQQVIEFFRKNPQAIERFRGPIFEDKVIDFLLGTVKVTEESVTPEALAADIEEE
jgi:trigger factor